jgi:hypothetical protein
MALSGLCPASDVAPIAIHFELNEVRVRVYE